MGQSYATVVVRIEFTDERLTGSVITYRNVIGEVTIESEVGWSHSDQPLKIQEVVGEAALAIRRAHEERWLTR